LFSEVPFYIWADFRNRKNIEIQRNLLSLVSFPHSPQSFWKNILPEGSAEKSWLYESESQVATYSYRDIQAKAHCVAAYLLQNGVERGEVVVIVAETISFQVISELGSWFAGVVTICLPENSGAEFLNSTNNLQVKNARYLFIESAKVIRKIHPDLLQHPSLVGIISGVETGENLPLHRMVTFERVLSLGNNSWRESRSRVDERKAKPQPEDICTCDVDGSGELIPVSYASFLLQAESIANVILKESIEKIWVRESPVTVDQRLHACYSPLSIHLPVFYSFRDLQLPFRSESLAFAALVTGNESLQKIYAALSDDGKGIAGLENKKYSQAYELTISIRECESNHRRIPAGSKIRSTFLQRTLYRQVRKKLGKEIRSIWYGPGDVPDYVSLLFEEAGISLLQLHPPQGAASESRKGPVQSASRKG